MNGADDGSAYRLRSSREVVTRSWALSQRGKDGVKTILGLRQGASENAILNCDVRQDGVAVTIHSWIDEAARQRLEQTYFGLRLLATTRDEWTTAQVIEAYRRQSRVESAFRDLKDPWVCAFRPQYHWTDQKLIVHALIAVLSLLLGRLLLRRAQRAGFQGSLRSLLHQLAKLRSVTVIDPAPGRGRLQVYQHTEECDPALRQLGRALGALRD